MLAKWNRISDRINLTIDIVVKQTELILKFSNSTSELH
jgi:hypothetical protein